MAARVRRVAILGNVCVGKTSVFDQLCAAGPHAINIPGSTRETQRGVLSVGAAGAARLVRRSCGACPAALTTLRSSSDDPCAPQSGPISGCPLPAAAAPGHVGASQELVPAVTHLFDTPGSATLAANSEDEMVARDLLLSGLIDTAVLVADAKNLRRSLALALEVAELGLPMVLDLNMVDEAENLGLLLDVGELSRQLGVPVVQTIGVTGMGVRRLAEGLQGARRPQSRVRFPASMERALAELEALLDAGPLPARGVAILLLSGDAGAQAWVRERLGDAALLTALQIVARLQAAHRAPLRALVADTFFEEAGRIADRVVSGSPRAPNLLVRFGGLAQRPIPGTLIALVVVAIAWLWVGAFGATLVVDTLSAKLLNGLLMPLCADLVLYFPSEFVRDALMDPDFGLLPTGLFLAVGVVLPILFCFYGMQAVLEDSGYLPRLGVLFDRLLRRLGLNGQALIPMVLGLSCVTMAVITARMLPTRRERVLLTFLLCLGIPCAPLLAVMLALLGKMPLSASLVVFGVMGAQVMVAGALASRLIPGKRPDLILEIPQIRIPRPRVLLAKTWRRTWDFMREAVPIFLLASFAVFVFDRLGGLAVLEDWSRPVVGGLLGLPDEATQVFLKTMIRRENGATELSMLRGQFDGVQTVVTLLVMTTLLPCINTAIVVVKERGVRTAMVIFVAITGWAIGVGALVGLVCRGLGLDFA